MRRATLALAVAGLVCSHQNAGAVVVSGSLYEDSAQNACGMVDVCAVSFAVLPSVTAGKLVRVTEIGCEFVASLPVRRVSLILTDQGGLNPRRTHYLPAPNQSGQFTYRTPVDFTISGGPPRQLLLYVVTENTSAILNAYCTIVGTVSAQ